MKIDPNGNYAWVPYNYTVTPNQLAANGSNITPLLTDEDAPFELHSIKGTTTADAATDFRPNRFSFTITDKNNSRIWSNDRIQQISLIPELILRRPVIISERSNLSFDFLNLTGAALTPTVILCGFKIIKP